MKEKIEDIARVRNAALAPWTGSISPEALEKLDIFIGEQLGWSARIHTVGKKNAGAALAAQIRDSLMMLRFARGFFIEHTEGGGFSGPIVDIGTGYGFPGFVWKLVDDGLRLTLVERKEKAAIFLERLVSSMKLNGIRIVNSDAEKDETLGLFRLFTSKAAGRLGRMLPLAMKLLENGGLYITIKERDWRWEIEGAGTAGMNFLEEEAVPEGGGYLVAFRKRDFSAR